ncbi:hypothetical protein J3Q64DRAFT_1885736 [Phycomyces blakesleeanus]|uniref:Uncharacterized protein n=2 Tax=Phycomyces blakesleeanus TaxID=4837 RepID=A0A167ND77_PHYB8|nr:hypothetical protein PHYBLDRAFT_166946 [Phycomyces blakesleeanus NRRL 1555(-)]OAD75719.1 hypothetical protein PHYBLDRAFT_166946 [Phycomyces blakesleeanus NRRL 1555(-)]|eukprot:XP_018293759.1 hypothetical protein PHYBLDRAFT_166946 [Phycomyces blakesleeanus NRRL 1555(-)]
MSNFPIQAAEAQKETNIINVISQMKALTRCANTAKAYDNRRQKYLDYCARICHTSSALVTETKLLDFLQQDVVLFGNRQRARRGKFRPNGSPYPLSPSSIDQYIKAVVDLHTDQKFFIVGINLQDPRGTLLKLYLRSLRLQEADRLRQSY